MSFFSQLAADIWNDVDDIIPSEIRAWALVVQNFIDGNAWQTVRKAGDTTRNSTTTLAADPDLTFAMEASTAYIVRGRIPFDAAATPDFKLGFTGPSSPTRIRGRVAAIATGATAYSDIAAVNAYETSGIAITGDGTTPGFVDIDLVVENGATSGNFQVTWAQNTSDAGDTKVLLGAYLDYRKVTP